MKLFGRNKKRNIELLPEDVFIDKKGIVNDGSHVSLEVPLNKNASYFLLFAIFLFFGFFSYYTYGLTISKNLEFSNRSLNNHTETEVVFANRGAILDRNGIPLAFNGSISTSSTTTVPIRKYIEGRGLAHVLGYVSYPQKDKDGILLKDHESYLGKDGLEKQYQSILQGVNGAVITSVKAGETDIVQETTVEKQIDGQSINISIDSDLNKVLYDSIKSLARKAGFNAGSGVIMDIHTGEILAMASYPEYDPNIMSNATGTRGGIIGEWIMDDRHIFLNRPVGGVYVPGSTVKPFVAYGAYVEGVIDPLTSIYSSGQLVVKNIYGGPDTIFRDWKKHGYVDMREAIAVSSDEYFYQVGGGFEDQKGLGIERIDKYMEIFGFGTTTGIDLPGEVKGNIPTPEWKERVFGTKWLLGDTYHTSIGQFGTLVTPLELVRAVSMIANGGKVVVPNLYSGHVASTTFQFIDLDQSGLKIIREGMRRAVTKGTAISTNVEGVTSAAKSGTAELGVDKSQVNSWMTGYFPYEKPRYAYVVTMEKAKSSNTFGAGLVMKDVFNYIKENTDYHKSTSTKEVEKGVEN